MSVNEANKIISEYMGYYLVDDEVFHTEHPCKLLYHAIDEQTDWIVKYSTSLDALVPVWEKLWYGDKRLSLMQLSFRHPMVSFVKHAYKSVEHISDGETIQEAAAIATAWCIKELSNE